MNIMDNNATYVIPLDGIDLNYITQTDFSKNELPLWSRNKQSSKEYYEFKIVAQKKQDSDNACKTENCLTDHVYQCQVCNINIPLAYKKQHTLSSKHKTCIKIIETAMDRAKNNLVQAQDNDCVKPASNSYFCEPCAIVVNTGKRQEHELTKDHFKSLMHDRFLNDLLMIYINKTHLDNVEFEYMNTNDNRDNVKNPEKITVSDFDDSDSDVANGSDDAAEEINGFMNLMQYFYDDSVEDVSDGKIGGKILEVNKKMENTNGINKNDALNLRDYITKLTSSSHSSSSPKLVVKDDKVELETSDKSILRLAEDHFHGFTRGSDSKIFCKLCILAVTDENNHKMSPEHIKWVMTPISDINGIREGNGIHNHCVLCNMSFDNIEGHKISDAHVNTLRRALCENVVKIYVLPTTAVKPGKTYCQPCGVYIDSHNFIGHTQGKPHKIKASAFSTEKNNKTVSNATDVNKNTVKQTLCAPCNIYVDTNDLTSHSNGLTHKNNVKSTTKNEDRSDGRSTKKSDKNNVFTRYCATCDLDINTNQYTSHINGSRHKSHLFTSSDLDPFAFKTLTLGNKQCRICNVKVPSNNHNMREHLRGENHRVYFTMTLSKYKIKKIDNRIVCGVCAQQFEVKTILDHIEAHEAAKPKLTRCRICDIQVTNTFQSVEKHEDSLMHLKNLNKHDHHHLERLDVFVRCKVCDLSLDVLESKPHVVSESHLQKFDSLLRDNKVLKRGNLYMCCLCSVVIQGDKVIDHIFTPDHEDLLNATDSRILKCIICDVQLPDAPKSIESHEQGYRHKENFKTVVEILNFEKGHKNLLVHSKDFITAHHIFD